MSLLSLLMRGYKDRDLMSVTKLLKHHRENNTLEVCFDIDLASRMQLEKGLVTFIKFEDGQYWRMTRVSGGWTWIETDSNWGNRKPVEFVESSQPSVEPLDTAHLKNIANANVRANVEGVPPMDERQRDLTRAQHPYTTAHEHEQTLCKYMAAFSQLESRLADVTRERDEEERQHRIWKEKFFELEDQWRGERGRLTDERDKLIAQRDAALSELRALKAMIVTDADKAIGRT